MNDIPHFTGPTNLWLQFCRMALGKIDTVDLPNSPNDVIAIAAFIERRLAK